MTPLQQLQTILSQRYTNEDGEEYQAKLLPGLSVEEIDAVAHSLPAERLPDEIRELLTVTRGITFGEHSQEITFDDSESFELEGVFPFAMGLTSDGAGDYWIVDIDATGEWGHVYYAYHELGVIVKHSENIAAFLDHVCRNGELLDSADMPNAPTDLGRLIQRNNNGFIERQAALTSGDDLLREFAGILPDNYVFADLRNKPNGAGFAWGKFGIKNNKIVRHPSGAPLWGVEKKEKKGLFSRLFGR